MAESIRNSLPPIYGHLFNAFFDRPKVVERRATCERCAMCDHGEPSPVPMEFFDPTTKCCTYWPMLPNYLVGAILADESPGLAEGKRRVRRAIERRIGVGPSFLDRPRKWSLIMTTYDEAFGRARSLKCPYYDDDNPVGSCSIWRHREGICHTYYCRYSGGMRGYEYWTALRSYLGVVQQILAKSASKAVDPSVVEPELRRDRLSAEDIDDLPPKDSDYRAWWGSWVGREAEFYVKCHEWVKAASPADFARNVDRSKEGQQALADLVAKYDALEAKLLPKSLVKNPRMREDHAGDKVVVTSYHRFDPIAIDKDLFEVVGLFEADQTLEQNLERLKRDDGIELAPELVEFLFAAGVLVDPASPRARAKGEDAGERAGRRAALRAVFEARDLVEDEVAKAAIDAAGSAKLDLWIKKAVVASSVAEVLKE
jgi:hypothetical protein